MFRRPHGSPGGPALALALGVAAITGGGCRRGADLDQAGSAPPPSASARPGRCTASTPPRAPDPVAGALFPSSSAGYCLDPNGDARAYGEGARAGLDDACTELLNGECEIYKRYGLRRVVTVRYIDGAGSAGAVAITLSRFGSREGAYGFFSKRVLGDGDPLHVTVTALPAGAAAVLGSGIAYVFRGEHLAELSYTNEAESPDQMRQSGRRVLPDIARAVGERLPGDPSLPAEVALLPTAERIPLGLGYAFTDALGVPGLGGGAVGYYARGQRRYRVVVQVRADEAAAGDLIETLKKVDRASNLKELLFPAVLFHAQRDAAAARPEWAVGRKGNQVLSVGDEELVLTEGASKEETDRKRLTRAEKVALLKQLVTGG